MPKFEPLRQSQILAAMIAKITSRTNLKDVSDTSAAKHILSCAAESDESLYFQMVRLLNLFDIDKASGPDLDERAQEIQPGLITRLPAVKSVGYVVFSRAVALSPGISPPATAAPDIIIPINTKVKTAGNVVFTTTQATSITYTSVEVISGHGVGRDSPLTPVVADVAGIAGNVAASTVIKFVSKPIGVDSVVNPTVFSLGLDIELDDSFRARIKAYIQSLPRSTEESLENCVLGISATGVNGIVRFSKAITDIINLGRVTVYVDDGTGSIETILAVPSEIVTKGLGGPVPDSAVGGETSLYLDYIAVKDSLPVTLVSSGVPARGTLTRGYYQADVGVKQFFLDPSNGKIIFDPALAAGEIITASYTRYTGLIAEAQKVILGDENDRFNYPGYEAAGVMTVVAAPVVQLQTVAVVITISEGYDSVTVKAAVKAAIINYINSLGISGDVILSEIVKRCKTVGGVYDISIVAPATNNIILDDQLARTSDFLVTVS